MNCNPFSFLYELCSGKDNNLPIKWNNLPIQALNYQDPLTGKTPLMAAVEKNAISLIKAMTEHLELDYELVDEKNQNILHWLMNQEDMTLLDLFPLPERLVPLLFQRDHNGTMPWDRLQYDPVVMTWLHQNDLLEQAIVFEINPLKAIVNKIVNSLPGRKIENRKYFQCLDILLKNPMTNNEKTRVTIEKIFLRQPEILFLIIRNSIEFNATNSVEYFMDFVKKNPEMTFDKEKNNWLIQAVQAEDLGLLMLTSVVRHFGTDCFSPVGSDGLNIVHYVARKGSLGALKFIHKHFGLQYFNRPDQYGRYPLHLTKKVDVILYLNKLNVPCNTLDGQGNSILHYLFNRKEPIDWTALPFLFSRDKMDLALLNHNKKSPLDHALSFNRLKEIDRIIQCFGKTFSTESMRCLIRSVTQFGCIGLLRQLKDYVNENDLPSESYRLLNHPVSSMIESVAARFSLLVKSGDIDEKTMIMALARLHDQLGKNFQCVVLHVRNMEQWFKQLKEVELEKGASHQTRYYLITDGIHWVCGELLIEDYRVTNILINDPMIDYYPTDLIYSSLIRVFPEAVIHLSGVKIQAADTFCALYCLDFIRHLVKVRDFLPERYQHNLYAYFKDHRLNPERMEYKTIKNWRETDNLCELPGYLMRTSRSLNGSVNSYRERRVVFWIERLSHEEREQFQLKKKSGVSLEQNMCEHISLDLLNQRIEYKCLQERLKLVDFLLKKLPEEIVGLLERSMPWSPFYVTSHRDTVNNAFN